jgi:oxygen-independent coproporphyrinogen-3 oxidase
VNTRHYSTWLQSLGSAQSLSLYIHLPFCRQLCWFCGCHTKIVHNYDPIEDYLALLGEEVRLVSGYLRDSAVKHIHFGGGSPTVVEAKDFAGFMEKLSTDLNLDKDTTIDIEIDPRTVSKKKIAAYAGVGVKRTSLGVQDFDDEVQKAINRVQPYSMVCAVVEMLRVHRIDAMNIDLIYGLPKQTLVTIRETIEKTISLAPDRISLFGYAHVPWMKKHQNMIREEHLPGGELRLEMFELASGLLEKAGYVPIGLDHFAKPEDPLARAAIKGSLQRNFQGYTTDGADALVGFGVTAISSLPQGYAQNTSNLKEYGQLVRSGEIPITRGVRVSPEDSCRRDIIMSLMCNLRANVEQNRFAEELEKLKPWMESGGTSYDGVVLAVNPNYRNQLRLIASVFDKYLPNTQLKYSQAV